MFLLLRNIYENILLLEKTKVINTNKKDIISEKDIELLFEIYKIQNEYDYLYEDTNLNLIFQYSTSNVKFIFDEEKNKSIKAESNNNTKETPLKLSDFIN